jgi:hypothetical protein
METLPALQIVASDCVDAVRLAFKNPEEEISIFRFEQPLFLMVTENSVSNSFYFVHNNQVLDCLTKDEWPL